MKDSTVRWCLDYHQLNHVTWKDVFPLPLIYEYPEFLGCQVSQNGVEKGDQYITAVQEWATPGNVKDNEKFLGFTKYHVPLYKLTSKKTFVWGAEQEAALNALWKALS